MDANPAQITGSNPIYQLRDRLEETSEEIPPRTLESFQSIQCGFCSVLESFRRFQGVFGSLSCVSKAAFKEVFMTFHESLGVSGAFQRLQGRFEGT